MKRYFYFLHSIALAGAVLSTAAVADPSPLRGLMCKTPEAVAQVFDYHEKNRDANPQEGLDIVNKEGEVCRRGLVVGSQVSIASHTPLNGRTLDIWQVNVSMACESGACMEVNMTVYMPFEQDKTSI